MQLIYTYVRNKNVSVGCFSSCKHYPIDQEKRPRMGEMLSEEEKEEKRETQGCDRVNDVPSFPFLEDEKRLFWFGRKKWKDVTMHNKCFCHLSQLLSECSVCVTGMYI